VPRGPKGERRPADVIGAAIMVAKIATGEIEDTIPTPESEGKDPAAVALGRKGGKARAAAIGKRKRTEIARKAAKSRWGK
jgi:RNase adaptor protein for sRNA GlmZ degradation